MPKIFISYRREDSQYQADRLHAALKRAVRDPRRDIFIDIDNIPVGVDFVAHLDAMVAQCDVLIAVIGPGWLNAGQSLLGGRRLDDPKDFVRIEIASALKRGITVAPVLLDGTPMPREDQLPADLKPLARRQGVEIRRGTFDTDAQRLIRGLDTSRIASPKPPRPASATPTGKVRPRMAPLIAVALISMTTAVAWVWFTQPQRTANAVPPASAPPTSGTEPRPSAPTAANAETAAAPGANAPAPSSSDVSATAGETKPAPTPAADLRRAGEVFRDCGVCPEMVVIPAGSFMMGSPASEKFRFEKEGPQRRVTVPAFAVGKYEVTQAQYYACYHAGGCAVQSLESVSKDNWPVAATTWLDANAYVQWLSRRTGHTYRLLSEAEWEYAARAGTTTAYAFGNSISIAQANFDGVVGMAAAVGQYPANAFGLHDMHGNVWEWVEDCHEESYAKGQPTNGRAYTGGVCVDRVTRGGGWSSGSADLRSAMRERVPPAYGQSSTGFRVARSLP